MHWICIETREPLSCVFMCVFVVCVCVCVCVCVWASTLHRRCAAARGTHAHVPFRRFKGDSHGRAIGTLSRVLGTLHPCGPSLCHHFYNPWTHQACAWWVRVVSIWRRAIIIHVHIVKHKYGSYRDPHVEHAPSRSSVILVWAFMLVWICIFILWFFLIRARAKLRTVQCHDVDWHESKQSIIMRLRVNGAISKFLQWPLWCCIVPSVNSLAWLRSVFVRLLGHFRLFQLFGLQKRTSLY